MKKIHVFFLTYLPYALLLLAGAAFTYLGEAERELDRLKTESMMRVSIGEASLRREIGIIADDLNLLSHSSTLRRAVNDPQESNIEQLANDFTIFSRDKPTYDQIRWLNENGMERVRVDRRNNSPVRVAQENLQDKSGRYYFNDTISLKEGQIFISPLDLNVEHEVVERPFKPMIRLGTPLYDDNNVKQGILLLNYLGRILLERFSSDIPPGMGKVELLNRKGFWLYSPTADLAWGFMLGSERTYGTEHPAAWERIRREAEGQFISDSGMFTFRTYQPLADLEASRNRVGSGKGGYPFRTNAVYVWKVVNHVTPEQLKLATRHALVKIGGSALILLVLGLVGSWVFAVTWQKQVEANKRAAYTAERALLLQTLGEGVYGIDLDGCCSFVNPAACKLLDYSEEQLLGRNMHRLISHHHEDGREYPAEDSPGNLCLAARRQMSGEGWYFQRDGTGFPVRYQATSTVDEQGGTVGVVVSFQDITRERSTSDALKLSNERLRLALQGANDGLWDWNLETDAVYFSPRWAEMLGYQYSEIEQTIDNWKQLVHPNDLDGVLEKVRGYLEGEQDRFTAEFRMRHRDGSWVNILSRARLATDKGGNPLVPRRLVGTHIDLTEKLQAEKRINQLENYDPLTQLPNRAMLLRRLGYSIHKAGDDKGKVVLFVIGLDNFKEVNETRGHAVGDKLLVKVADRMGRELQSYELLARLGGDEFALLVDNLEHSMTADELAKRIIYLFEEPLTVDGVAHHVSASIGIAVYPNDSADGITLMKNADTALFQAKSSGRKRYGFFSSELADAIQERYALSTLLRKAIDHGELELHYQPQVLLADGRLTGVEALARWNSPSLGQISPERFIPLAEETGMIVSLGQWALNEACMQIRRWLDEGRELEYVAVNVSAVQFSQNDLVAVVEQALHRAGIEGSSLELEITESFVVTESEKLDRTLSALRQLGVRLAIDDFGTGYSSLTYLKKLQVHRLKIDRSFVRGMINEANDAAIVRAIIALGQNLGMDVLAEGVETETHVDELLQLGCQAAQGWHFGKPVPGELLFS